MGVRMRLTNDAINSDVRLLIRRENPARLLASGSQPLRRPASGERGRSAVLDLWKSQPKVFSQIWSANFWLVEKCRCYELLGAIYDALL